MAHRAIFSIPASIVGVCPLDGKHGPMGGHGADSLHCTPRARRSAYWKLAAQMRCAQLLPFPFVDFIDSYQLVKTAVACVPAGRTRWDLGLKERLDVAARVSSGIHASMHDQVCSIVFFIEFWEHGCRMVRELQTADCVLVRLEGTLCWVGGASILHVTTVSLLRDL